MKNTTLKYNFYRKLILWFPVFSGLITLLLSLGIIYFTFQNYYTKEKEAVKSEFFSNLKTITKQRVTTALKVLNQIYNISVINEKEKLKEILDIIIKNKKQDIKTQNIKIKISKEPLKLDTNKYIVVFKKKGDLFYYVYENKDLIKNKIKKEIATLFDAFRWGKKGYLFVHNPKGICYYHINKSFIGENKWNLKRGGVYIVRKLIKAALSHPNGAYVEYLAYNPSGKPIPKISFIVYDKNMDLTIGSGIYLNELNKRLFSLEMKNKILLRFLIKRLLVLFLILFIVFVFIAIIISEVIFKRFKKYEEKLFLLEIEKREKECKDEFTGLLNRKCLKKEFEKYKNQNIAVMDIDVNDFRNINEIYGNKIGNKIVKILAEKLKNIIKRTDILGKGKIDEFILLIRFDKKNDIVHLIKRVYDTLSRSIKIDSKEIYPSVRIGIAFNKTDSNDFDDLVNKASMSAYNAKKNDVKIAYYNKEIDGKLKKYLEIKNELIKMMKTNDFSEFEIHYQPQIDKNEHLAGMEALIRWNHPEKGVISPGEFLPVAINEGFIKKIDLWTIESVIKQIKIWLNKGYNPGVISCNVTMQQLESRDFISKLTNLIQKYNFDTKYLGIEVTEESIMQNAENVNKSLYQIKDLGIVISLDDFGTGYSNFMKLKTLPIDKLKIDKSFIDGIPDDKNDVALTKIVIQTGKILNLSLIAEGVETKKQKDFVFENGVDYIQGYYYSKPLPANEIEKKYFNSKS